jgi:hypothetical protein
MDEMTKEIAFRSGDAYKMLEAIHDILNVEGISDLPYCQKIEAIEKALMQYEQVEIPVMHLFSDGMYIRQILIPKGTLLTSRYHKREQLDVMLSGSMSIVTNDGIVQIKAPFSGVSKPGLKRIGYAHEDTLWMDIRQNPDNERNISKIEKALYTDSFDEVRDIMLERDREDYKALLDQRGVSEDAARSQAENEVDQIAISLENVEVSKSEIEGLGLFPLREIAKGEVIAPARISGKRTQAGRYTNHAVYPNAIMVLRENGDIDLVSERRIRNEEITIDYRQALSLAREGVRPCLE